jgi:16S rRNA (uracil1498-N3)-methyltransferase
MKIHRFYASNIKNKLGSLELDKNIWIHDQSLLTQWLGVLKFKIGSQLVLFDDQSERLYEITQIESSQSVNLSMLTEQKRILPQKHIYLLWALSENDENERIIQKSTELDVRNFIPVITNKNQNTVFDIRSAREIIIKTSEQCGRADIADIREPIFLAEALAEYQNLPLFICGASKTAPNLNVLNKIGFLIGPPDGWPDKDKELVDSKHLPAVNVNDSDLKTEEDAILAALKLIQ